MVCFSIDTNDKARPTQATLPFNLDHGLHLYQQASLLFDRDHGLGEYQQTSMTFDDATD